MAGKDSEPKGEYRIYNILSTKYGKSPRGDNPGQEDPLPPVNPPKKAGDILPYLTQDALEKLAMGLTLGRTDPDTGTPGTTDATVGPLSQGFDLTIHSESRGLTFENPVTEKEYPVTLAGIAIMREKEANYFTDFAHRGRRGAQEYLDRLAAERAANAARIDAIIAEKRARAEQIIAGLTLTGKTDSDQPDTIKQETEAEAALRRVRGILADEKAKALLWTDALGRGAGYLLSSDETRLKYENELKMPKQLSLRDLLTPKDDSGQEPK